MKQSARKAISVSGFALTFATLFVINLIWVQTPTPTSQPNQVTGQVVAIHLKSGLRYVTETQDKIRTWSAFAGVLIGIGFLMFGQPAKNEISEAGKISEKSVGRME